MYRSNGAVPIYRDLKGTGEGFSSKERLLFFLLCD